MTLKTLLTDVPHETLCGNEEVTISSIAYDSRKVNAGSLFVCIRGFATDGHQYIKQADEAGAAAIIVEEAPAYEVSATVIKVEDSREALALISAAWFHHPAKNMTVIGLTGTKGKTTTAHMIKKILEEAGHKTGMIGTIGAFIGEEKLPTKNTTPESYELHSIFAQMLDKGCEYVVMEVSSQGLKQKRTAGIAFDYGAFLNISPDHIGAGEHENFEEYLSCKKLLFLQTKCSVINIDDERWQEVTEYAKEKVTFSTQSEADFTASDIHNIWEPGLLGVSFTLSGREQGNVTLSLPGEFNVANALAAISITRLCGIEMPVICSALKRVAVKGRTQFIPEVAHFTTFIIDYAHNALSMESLLAMLKSYHPKRLICLFGAGGNKPKQRRYDMGEKAGKYADLTIITTDNPRFEAVEDINVDIIRGLEAHHGKYEIMLDRKEAIHYLIDNSGRDDIVVLIGKGHEEYQEINGVKYHFSEHEIIQEYVKTK